MLHFMVMWFEICFLQLVFPVTFKNLCRQPQETREMCYQLQPHSHRIPEILLNNPIFNARI